MNGLTLIGIICFIFGVCFLCESMTFDDDEPILRTFFTITALFGADCMVLGVYFKPGFRTVFHAIMTWLISG